MSYYSKLETYALLALTSIAILMFFFPLISIQAPIAGEQDVSGFDIVSKVSRFEKQVGNSTQRSDGPGAGRSTAPTANRRDKPDIPLSLQLAWLIPVNVFAALVSAGVTFAGAGSKVRVSRLAAMAGAAFSLVAVLHVILADSDLHSWLSFSFKGNSEELKGNSFAALADKLGNLMLNAFEIRPGFGLYVLATVMLLAAFISRSRILTRLKLVSPDELTSG